jgi:hypothetical protein
MDTRHQVQALTSQCKDRSNHHQQEWLWGTQWVLLNEPPKVKKLGKLLAHPSVLLLAHPSAQSSRLP